MKNKKIGIVSNSCDKMDSLKASLLANGIEVEIIPPDLIPPDQAISDENIYELKTITKLSNYAYSPPLGKFKHKGQPWKKKGKNRRF